MSRTAHMVCLLIVFVSVFILNGCKTSGLPEFPDDEINNDIFADPGVKPTTINAEVFLDASSSMRGYTNDEGSTYIKFISELEAAITSGTRNSKITYYKFGTKVKQINRRTAIFQGSDFYDEKGISESTCIDSVLARTNENVSTIILTDLFQSNGDVNTVVEQFKMRCFVKGLDIGIVLVPSEFDGMVYGQGSPYHYSSTMDDIGSYKPFFVIFIGKAPVFLHLVEALKSTAVKNAISEENIMLLPKRIVSSSNISIAKNKDPQYRNSTKRWVSRGYSGKNPYKDIFRVTLARGEDPVPFTVTLDEIKPVKYLPGMDLDNIKVEVIKLGPGKDKYQQSDEFQLSDIAKDGSNKTMNLLYKSKFEGSGSSYKMLFSISALQGMKVPKAFTQNSSQNPSGMVDPNKTLNLEKFITDLTRSYLSINTGYIAKGYLYVDFK